MKNDYRTRQWSILTYAKEEEFSDLLNSAEHWAWAYHDKDENEPHTHILLVFKHPRAFQGIKAMIKSEQNTLGDPIKKGLHEMYEYLVHKGKPEKHQYPDECRKADDNSFWEEQKEKEPETDFLIDDILMGTPLRVLARKYGRDYMRNKTAYESFAFQVALQEKGYKLPYQLYEQRADFRALVQRDKEQKDILEQTKMQFEENI